MLVLTHRFEQWRQGVEMMGEGKISPQAVVNQIRGCRLHVSVGSGHTAHPRCHNWAAELSEPSLGPTCKPGIIAPWLTTAAI